MVNNKMIEIKQDLDSLSYDTGIEIKINKDVFDDSKKFAKLTSSQFDNIMMADSSLNRENILVAFLYINSYIGCRKRNEDGSEKENAKDNPEAFFKSISNMAKDLSMSKDTINQCVEYLTKSTDERDALLIKREVGSVQPDKTKPPQNIPNIYVLNKEGYEQEVKWAIEKIIDLYKPDEIYPFVKGNNQKWYFSNYKQRSNNYTTQTQHHYLTTNKRGQPMKTKIKTNINTKFNTEKERKLNNDRNTT